MASENVKIVIDEYDLTTPGGAGIAPSDIAFIPGFSVKADAPKNIPTMCSDVYEFEKFFGKEPRILTTRDVAGYEHYGFIAGQYDKSYIYAKELLYLGMPVVYSNIVNTHNVEHPNITTKKFLDAKESNHKSTDYFELGSYNETDGSIALTAKQSFTGDETIRFMTKYKATPAKNNIPTVTTFEIDATIPKELHASKATIRNILLSVPTSTAGAPIESLSNNQLEFTNKTDKVIEYDVAIDITLDINLEYETGQDADNRIELVINEIPSSCLDVFYQTDASTEECDAEEHYDSIFSQLKLISDKSVYSVKYITSGGYPSVVCQLTDGNVDKLSAKPVFSADMLLCAAERGDAVALIDYQMAESEQPFNTDPKSGSFYAKMHKLFNGVNDAEFGAMMYPWGQYSCGATLGRIKDIETTDVYMPGSFAYMKCLAKAIKTSPNWLAMAGVSRGLVPNLNMIMTPRNVLSNTTAEEMQPKFGVENHSLSINCITNIRPYGLTLWGNRTLKPVSKEGCVALNFLNTRNMLSDIKKVLYSTAKSLMFEQNSDTLWLRFKAGITPLLNQLKSGQGISDYKIVKGTTKYNGDPLQKGEMAAVIKIYPLYAVEYFELAVEINDEEVTVS